MFWQYLEYTTSDRANPGPLERSSQTKEELFFDTIRADILTRYPGLAELVHRRFPTDPTGEQAFRFAVELYLRALPKLTVSLDGWNMLQIVRDTATSFRAVNRLEALEGCLSLCDGRAR